MCGIVGYIGNGNVYDVLIRGLKRLEYRGYDSAGIALLTPNNKINVYKTRGKVSALESFCRDKSTDARLGIAHTRWATHGEPNDTNAHPHFSEDGNLALVHNGTIENFKVLKDALQQHGVNFHTETDTEVLVQLSAVISALNGTGRAILKDHISHCIVDAVEAGDQEAIQALNDAIDRFMR